MTLQHLLSEGERQEAGRQIKARLLLLGPHEFDELRKAADYRTVLNTLRPRASIIWGGIFIAVGVLGLLGGSTLSGLLALFGVVYLFNGWRFLNDPTPDGIRIDGALSIALGIANLVIAVLGRGEGWYVLIGLLGVWMIYQGAGRFRFHRRFAGRLLNKPAEERLIWLNELAVALLTARFQEDKDLIEFTMQSRPWRGWLLSGRCVFMDRLGQTIRLARKDDVTITRQGTLAWMTGEFNVTLHIESEMAVGMMIRESFEKYERWKSTPGPTVER